MLRNIRFVAAVGGLLLAGSATAQVQSSQGSHNPAVKDPTPVSTGAPARGANSFTEDQARGRFVEGGYTDVSALKKNGAGQWTASANRDGKSVTVMLDYKGNISQR